MTKAVRRFQKGLPEITRPHIQPSLGDIREPEITGGIEPGHGNAGYVINALWTDFERLTLTEYTGLHSVRLAVEIALDGVGAMAQVVELPLAEIKEVATRKRVKPRKAKEAEAKPNAKPKRRIQLEVVSDESAEENPKKKAVNDGADS